MAHKRHYYYKISLITLILFIFSSISIAQSPPFERDSDHQNHLSEVRIPGTNPVELLKLPQVQQELELTSEQIDNLQQIDEEFHPQIESQEQEETLAQQQYKQEQQAEQGRELIAQVLNPFQINRFKEITLQIYGWGAMSDEEVREILVLTPEQQTQILEIRIDINQKIKGLWEMSINYEEQDCHERSAFMLTKIQELTEEYNQKTYQILEEDQRQILEYMKGESFVLDLDKLQPLCERN